MNFKRPAFILVLTIAAALSMAAQVPAPNPAPAPTPAPAQAQTPAPAIVQANPALWVVKGPHATVYLFGTIHVLKPGIAWQTPKVLAATDASQSLIEEIADIDDTAAMQPLIKQLGTDPDHPLSTKISKDDLALVDSAIKQMGAPGESVLEPLRPWLAGLTLSVLPMLKAGYDPKSGVDMTLAAAFKTANKPVTGLETVEEQLHIFSDMPLAQEVESLHIQLKNLDHSTADLDSTVTAWEKGDVETIAKIENDVFIKDDPALYQKLVVQRNKNWTERLVKLLQGEGTTFVAVGAAHLAGPDSVLKMLEARGFKITTL